MVEQNYDPGMLAAGFGAMFWLFAIGAYLLFAYLQYRMADKCGCKQNA